MIPEKTVLAIITVVFSYLLGSIPTAYLLAKSRNINIFEVGSGNMGGTNMARALGMRWGLLTAVIDFCKGMLAIIIAREIIMPDYKGTATTISSIVVIMGHNWSLFATLLTARVYQGRLYATIRGGKGAATALGTMLIVARIEIVVMMLALGGLIVALTRYVSLGVLVAFTVAVLWMIVLVGMYELPNEMIIYLVALTVMMLIRFRENIHRLLTGTERRLGEPA